MSSSDTPTPIRANISLTASEVRALVYTVRVFEQILAEGGVPPPDTGRVCASQSAVMKLETALVAAQEAY